MLVDFFEDRGDVSEKGERGEMGILYFLAFLWARKGFEYSEKTTPDPTWPSTHRCLAQTLRLG